MTNLKCGICHENIYLYYYKSDKCECNVRYHISCAIKWHKINKICIYCKKKTTINLEKNINRYLEHIVIFINILFMSFILYYNLYYCKI